MTQCEVIEYDRIRDHEEAELAAATAKASMNPLAALTKGKKR